VDENRRLPPFKNTSSSKKKIVRVRKKTTPLLSSNPKIKQEHIFDHLKRCGFTLYEYQKKGIIWMLNRELHGKCVRGGLLCDEPGLGKTIQTCAMLYGNYKRKTLLIVPAAVLIQWINTINIILPNSNIYIHRGSNRCRTVYELMMEHCDIVITTLNLVYNSKYQRLTVLHSITWDRIIIDEIHYIRNSSSKRAKACYQLKGTHKWGLTGTPIQNSESDLVSLYTFLEVPGINTFCLEIANKYLLLRRTLSMVEKESVRLKMPMLIQKNHIISFDSDRERTIYAIIKKNVSQEFYNILNNTQIPKNKLMVMFFELLLRLKQVSIHPQLVINGLSKKFNTNFTNYIHSSTKINKLIDILKNNTNHNCLVFCQFRGEMNLIQKYLLDSGLKSERYDGSLNITERETVLSKFVYREYFDILEKRVPTDIVNHIDTFHSKILLIQINSGGVGLNLQKFTKVIIISPDWNPSNEIQAIARAYRIGQVHPVTVHRLLLYDDQNIISTIDKRINVVQLRKRSIMSTILNDTTYMNIGNMFGNKLTHSDYRVFLE